MESKTVLKILTLATFLSGGISYSQDLTSINVGVTLPTYTFNASTNEITAQMTVRNVGFFNSNAFDVALFLKNVNTNTEYEIDRVNQSGLSYNQLNNANTLYITNWVVDLDSEPQVPLGTYRLIAKINDNQNATETNYTNNNELFGNKNFSYTSSSVGLKENLKQSSVSVYPNPTEEYLYLKTEGKSLSEFRLLAMDGRLLLKETITNSVARIELADLPAGIYFAEISGPEFLVTKKIIKE